MYNKECKINKTKVQTQIMQYMYIDFNINNLTNITFLPHPKN